MPTNKHNNINIGAQQQQQQQAKTNATQAQQPTRLIRNNKRNHGDGHLTDSAVINFLSSNKMVLSILLAAFIFSYTYLLPYYSTVQNQSSKRTPIT